MHLEEQYIPGTRFTSILKLKIMKVFCNRVVCKTKSTSTGIVISKIVITFTYNTNVSSNGSYSFLVNYKTSYMSKMLFNFVDSQI